MPTTTAPTQNERETYYASINANGDYVELKLRKGGYGAVGTLMGYDKTKPTGDGKVKAAGNRSQMLEGGYGVPLVVVYKNARGRQAQAKVVCPVPKIEELFKNGKSSKYRGFDIVNVKPVTKISVSV